MAKNKRQDAIKELIKNNDISTQAHLTDMLISNGFNVTQATVSRDLQEMRIIKAPVAGGGYKYAIAYDGAGSDASQEAVLKQCLKSVDYAVNIVVLKTFTGAAQAVGYAIDTIIVNDVLGTIAGDDTIMIVARTEEAAKQLCESIKSYLK